MHTLTHFFTSFMPMAIANCTPGHCRTAMFYKGVTEPPVRWEAWQDLVAAFAQHMVERYTLDVVAKFKFEVWNGECACSSDALSVVV